MTRLSTLLLFTLIACGPSPSAKSADDASETEPTEEASPERAGPDTDEPREEAAAEATTATPADIQAILQAVLDDDALTPYLHLERPERFPVRIAGSAVPSGIELVKGAKPVQIVDQASAGDPKKPVLVVTELEVKGDKAFVAFRYDVEKVRGSATVVKSDGAWTLEKSRVTTREVSPSE